MIHEDILFQDFVGHLRDLDDFDESDVNSELLMNKFLHLALTGQLKSSTAGHESTQYTLMFDDHRLDDDLLEDVQCVRDYDSLLGFTNNLPYSIPISLHLSCQPLHQLKKSIHVYVDRELVEPIMVHYFIYNYDGSREDYLLSLILLIGGYFHTCARGTCTFFICII